MSPCKLQVPEHVRFFVYIVEILVSEDYRYDENLWESDHDIHIC